MARINVMPQDLKDLGNKLIKLSSDYDDTIIEIDKVFKEIDSLLLWDGEDEESYIDKIDERYMETLKKIGIELYDYGDFLVKTSDGYASLENYFKEREVEV